MSARAGRAAVKAARAPLPNPPRLGKRFPAEGAGKTTAASLPKRANPHLSNLKPDPPSSGVPPRVLTILGVGFLGISTYIGYLYASYRLEIERGKTLNVPEDVSDRYYETASTYDADIEMSETLLRMKRLRQELVQQARGHVLEVCCGTGRNSKYYDMNSRTFTNAAGVPDFRGCKSVTFVDSVPEMAERAYQKFKKIHGQNFPRATRLAAKVMQVNGFSAMAAPSLTARGASDADIAPVLTGDPQAAPPYYFDTIVQTFGLCSMSNAVQSLRHLGTIVEPTHGRILLLEHGESKWGWLNEMMDQLAPGHASRHGCWYNKNIEDIVRKSGLQVVSRKRCHAGTTYMYVLRPVPGAGGGAGAGGGVGAGGAGAGGAGAGGA